MKDFHCSDTGMKCDFVVSGNTNEEILKKSSEHALKAHQMKITPELAQKVEGLIHEKGGAECQRSSQRA